MDKANRAKEILKHYFKTLYEHTGLNWDWDNAAEIEHAVDMIIETVKEDH